jgi:hypothetical protein
MTYTAVNDNKVLTEDIIETTAELTKQLKQAVADREPPAVEEALIKIVTLFHSRNLDVNSVFVLFEKEGIRLRKEKQLRQWLIKHFEQLTPELA